MRSTVTISVPNNTTQDEIKEIRKIFKEQYPDYKLNILISGKQDMKITLKNIIADKIHL